MPFSRYEPASSVIDGAIAALARAHDAALGPPLPTRAQLAELVEMAFWASLRRDESRPATFTLTWSPPVSGPRQFRFSAAMALTPGTIAQLAPALREGHTSLAVVADGDGFAAWGILDVAVPRFVTVEAVEPGLVVVRHGRRNVAVFAREYAALVNAGRLDARNILRQIFPEDVPEARRAALGDALADLATAMRRLGHGGAVLLVPSANRAWERSVQQPMRYAASPPSDVLERAIAGAGAVGGDGQASGQAHVEDAVEFVASLTAVDGAILLDGALRVIAFGVKITAAEEPATVLAVSAVGGVAAAPLAFEQLGGTRHQSAARFVYAHHDAAALVASIDGELTVIGWLAERGQVIAVQHTQASLL